MVTEILRTHNVCHTRFVRDSTQDFWIRYYPSAPGALALPIPTAFGHPVWEPERDEFTGAGVYYRGLQWRRKSYPAPPGKSYRGDPAWFADGLPAELLSAPETGERCGVPTIVPTGGVVLGGTAYAVTIVSTACQCESADSVVGPLVSTACQCESADSVVGPGPWIVSTACQCESADSVVGPGPWIVSTACQCESAYTASSAPPALVSSLADQSEEAISSPTVHSVASQSEAPDSAMSVHSVADQAEQSVSSTTVHSVASQSEGPHAGPAVYSVADQSEDAVTEVSTDSGETTACTECPDGAPLVWAFELEGCTGDFAEFNGTYRAAWDNDCQWFGEVFGHYPIVQFSVDSWFVTFFDADTGHELIYKLTGAWACLGPNTLPEFFASGSGTFPGTITVVKG